MSAAVKAAGNGGVVHNVLDRYFQELRAAAQSHRRAPHRRRYRWNSPRNRPSSRSSPKSPTSV
ncbi:hypothetical protein NKH18_47150 [Streptomyces sp. M10(2022)]